MLLVGERDHLHLATPIPPPAEKRHTLPNRDALIALAMQDQHAGFRFRRRGAGTMIHHGTEQPNGTAASGVRISGIGIPGHAATDVAGESGDIGRFGKGIPVGDARAGDGGPEDEILLRQGQVGEEAAAGPAADGEVGGVEQVGGVAVADDGDEVGVVDRADAALDGGGEGVAPPGRAAEVGAEDGVPAGEEVGAPVVEERVEAIDEPVVGPAVDEDGGWGGLGGGGGIPGLRGNVEALDGGGAVGGWAGDGAGGEVGGLGVEVGAVV